ncbi:unnamed protein product, partial [Meganyctiphanes norvegica]
MYIFNNTTLKFMCGSNASSCLTQTDLNIIAYNSSIPFNISEKKLRVPIKVRAESGIAVMMQLQIKFMPQAGLKLEKLNVTNQQKFFTCVQQNCSLNSILRSGNDVEVEVILKQDINTLVGRLVKQLDNITLVITATCLNPDIDDTNNNITLIFSPHFIPSVHILNMSVPESVLGEAAEFSDGQKSVTFPRDSFLLDDPKKSKSLGLIYQHRITLRNTGTTRLPNLTVNIEWPVIYLDDDILVMLLVQQPVHEKADVNNNCDILNTPSSLISNLLKIQCDIINLEVNEVSQIKVEGIILKSYFEKIGYASYTFVSSWSMELESPSGTRVKTLPEASTNGTISTVLTMRPPPAEVPVWAIILGVIGGILLLVALGGVLYKIGFFKRKRPPVRPASQQRTSGRTEDPQQVEERKETQKNKV